MRLTNAPTSYVWIWSRDEEGYLIDMIGTLKAGQEFADVMDHYLAPGYAVVDTLGQWAEVVPYLHIGYTTRNIDPPQLREGVEE